MTTPSTDYDTLLQTASRILDAPSADVKRVFDVAGQLTKAAAAQCRVADEAIARTTDPRTLSADLSAAVAEAEAAKLNAARLENTAQLVEEKHLELVMKANAAVAAEEYDYAASEVRRVVARKVRDFPGLRSPLVIMFEDIMAVQELAWAANRKLPAGKPAINGPEGVMGGFDDFAPGNGSLRAMTAIRLTSSVLPSDEPTRPAWPPLSAKMAWTFQAQVRLMAVVTERQPNARCGPSLWAAKITSSSDHKLAANPPLSPIP